MTHAHGSGPSQRNGGLSRRTSRPLLATSRSRCHACSETRKERLIGSPSASSQEGMCGTLHAGPWCVNGHSHVPESSSQLP